MNITPFYHALGAGLGQNLSAVGISDLMSDPTLTGAAMDACRAYSRYRPFVRRLGDATLAAAAQLGTTTLSFVGGLPAVGDDWILEPGGWSTETVTIAGVELDQAIDTDAADSVGNNRTTQTLTITLESPTTKAHAIGAYASSVVPSGQKRGLTITDGQETYLLPLDFIKPVQRSLDEALGMGPGQESGSEGYYDISYFRGMNQFSGVGFGYGSAYAPGAGVFGVYPIVGNPLNNPNGFPNGQQQPCGVRLRFTSAPFPQLQVSPIPTSTFTILFDYQGLHTLSSIPENDADALCDYARYWGTMAQANAFAGRGKTSIKNDQSEVSRDLGKSTENLLALAQGYLDSFEKKIRNRPFAISG